MELSILIERVFSKMQYVRNEDYIEYDSYYLTYNMFTDDSGSKSAMIFKESGNLKVYDHQFKIKRGGSVRYDTVLTLTEWIRRLGLFYIYIDFVLQNNAVRKGFYSDYKDALSNFMFFNSWDAGWRTVKKYKKLRKTLFNNYILDKDVIANGEREIETFEKKKTKPVNIKSSSSILIEKAGPLQELIASDYASKRKINISDNVSLVTVGFQNGKYKYPGIAFTYPSGFRKVRVIRASLRYIANKDNGNYEDLFEARVDNSKTCYIIEGEIDALSVLDFVEGDVFAMHNTNSLPANLNQLRNYNKIIVKVDYDKFDEVKDGLKQQLKDIFPKKIVSIEYKIKSEDKQDDYNSYLLKGKLGGLKI